MSEHEFEEHGPDVEVAKLLRDTSPEPPLGLAESVTRAVLRDRMRRRARPWWGLAAAAVAAVALGIGIASDPGPGDVAEIPAYVAEAPVEGWVSDDGEVAGMASLDGLSDEALMTLLEELGTGGAA